MSLTQTAIERNRVTVVALLVIVFAGFSAYQTMPQNEDPGFIIRAAQVLTFFPGASPERVELLVSDKLEKVIQEIPELDFVTSTSRDGVSIIIMNILESERDMRPIWDDLRRKIERGSRDLPDGVIGPFVNDEFGDVFGTVIALTGEGYSYAELKEVADQVRNVLLDIQGRRQSRDQRCPGRARVRPVQQRTPGRPWAVCLPTQKHPLVTEHPPSRRGHQHGRRTNHPRTVWQLRIGRAASPNRHQPAGRNELVYLEDIAEVYRGYVDPPTEIVRSSNQPALVLGVSLREGGNLIRLGNDVRVSIARLQERYPIGLEFDVIYFQPQIVEKKVDEFVSNLVQAIIIVVVVMLLSLGVRTGLIVSSLIPMTMIMSIWVMTMFDIGLDQMSLSALIIALGLLVDNAIVMSESIQVRMSEGDGAKDAAVKSAEELRIPLLTASLTTAAAFLPIYLAESTVGEYTAPLFQVVSIALLCSWVLALTMIPTLSVQYMKVQPAKGDETFGSRPYVFIEGFCRRVFGGPL